MSSDREVRIRHAGGSDTIEVPLESTMGTVACLIESVVPALEHDAQVWKVGYPPRPVEPCCSHQAFDNTMNMIHVTLANGSSERATVVFGNGENDGESTSNAEGEKADQNSTDRASILVDDVLVGNKDESEKKPASGHTHHNPIEINDDDDSSSVDVDSVQLVHIATSKSAKRPAHEDNRKPSSKRHHSEAASQEATQSAGIPPTSQSHFRLFATIQDQRARQNGNHNDSLRPYCQTLREMLGFENHDIANSSIDFMIIMNFMIDFDFLLETLPELVSIERMVVFYGTECEMSPETRRALSHVEFRLLKPGDPPRSRTNPLSDRIPYGVHHSKAFLVGRSNGTLRVMIHTANLLYGDIHLKAQGAYIQDFDKKERHAGPASDFKESLVTYLETYGYTTRRPWSSNSEPTTLSQHLRGYDFSGASVVLLPSTPGRHYGNKSQSQGYLKLHKAIETYTDPNSPAGPMVCQFSSMGSLNAKWLTEFATPNASGKKIVLQNAIRLVYPTVEEVRSSIEGYRGGGSVPGRTKNVSKPFLKPLLCKWSQQTAGDNPLDKKGHVPHVKTFYQLDDSDSKSFKWFALSSHNLSMAAWGQLQKGNYGKKNLFVRSWELGVFVSPELLQQQLTSGVASSSNQTLRPRLVPLTRSTLASGDIAVPVPYSVPPQSYSSNDVPWAVDSEYRQADNFGRYSAYS